MTDFNQLIHKICNELNIKMTLLSDNWLTLLEKDDQVGYIQGYKFSLNNHGIGNIMDDKGLFYDLALNYQFPIIEHYVIFKDYKREDIIKYFHLNNDKLVIKGNIGTCGMDVYLVNSEELLFKTLDKLFNYEFSVSLSPYYDIENEYRVIVLNNETRLIYGKIRPIIKGDDIKNVFELAQKFNSNYYTDIKMLENPLYIPKKDEEIILNWQFNLSKGAKMFLDIDTKLKEKLSSLALEVSRKFDIVFGSIDIIKTKDDRLFIMEANSGVMMDHFMKLDKNGYNIAYDIYRDAVKLMFEKN